MDAQVEIVSDQRVVEVRVPVSDGVGVAWTARERAARFLEGQDILDPRWIGTKVEGFSAPDVEGDIAVAYVIRFAID